MAGKATIARNVGGKWRRGAKIGAGAFGEIYRATHIETGEEVAMKVLPMNAKVQKEVQIQRHLAGEKGMPEVHWYGVEGRHKVIVMNLMGPSLEDMFNACDRKFPVKLVLTLAEELITRMQSIHVKGVIHCDVKPDNFLIGDSTGSGPVHIIDFGLSKMWQDAEGDHIDFAEEDVDMGIGTASFSSLRSHTGVIQTRRDDLEAVAHLLIYFLRGKLPWQGLKAENKWEEYGLMRNMKGETSLEDLCAGLPLCFLEFLSYCRSLDFNTTPDYDRCRKWFKDELEIEVAAHAHSE